MRIFAFIGDMAGFLTPLAASITITCPNVDAIAADQKSTFWDPWEHHAVPCQQHSYRTLPTSAIAARPPPSRWCNLATPPASGVFNFVFEIKGTESISILTVKYKAGTAGTIGAWNSTAPPPLTTSPTSSNTPSAGRWARRTVPSCPSLIRRTSRVPPTSRSPSPRASHWTAIPCGN